MANHTPSTQSQFFQHHFVDAEQQLDASKMGMWIFLATEILMFGGLFGAYIIYRFWYPELFVMASKELNTLWGTVNTFVLLGIRLTVAMAVKSAHLYQ